MLSLTNSRCRVLLRSSAFLAIATASLLATPAFAQVAKSDAEAMDKDADIVVTGTRIDRAGFDAPTPTIVIGQADIQLGARASIGAVLQDQPQFRATTTPSTNPANTNSGSTTADLRGLGAGRTLTLLNGRRFIGDADLNNVPLSVVKRVEVVTGGASAAWGSGAIAGVANLILDDDLTGLKLGGQAGVSSRGDAARYGLDGSFGTKFAGGRGHVMVAAEYLKEDGAFGRNSGSRPNLDAGFFTTPAGQLQLVQDLNFTNAYPGGVITSGVLAGQVFNSNGTLSPFPAGATSNATTTIGGGGRSQLDYAGVSSPYRRANIFARASFDLSNSAKIWVDGRYSSMKADNIPFFPEVARATATTGGYLIQRDNAFLSTAIRNQLIAAGQTSFRLGRTFDDVGPDQYLRFSYDRTNVEGAVGIDGNIGSWKYSAYFGHGEFRDDNTLSNQRIVANFNNAVDAIISPTTGLPICRIALTTPTTDCRPFNILGSGNASAASIAYAFGAARSIRTARLDTTGITIKGDLINLWAGPLSVATGAEARWESSTTNYVDPLSLASALATVNNAPVYGKFNVKEGFVEAALPLLDAEGVAKIEVNGAARYSDYSTSGGIWSWKAGATARLFDSVLLRAVRSRDIRSPSIGELYSLRTTNIQSISDPTRNNEVVTVFRYGGGNPALVPEIAQTTTIGATFSPKFMRGLSLSIDYYKIDIDKVIGTLSGQDIVTQCFRGNTSLCGQIVRDSTGQITTIFATNLNLASYKTRGIDFEASYVLPKGALGTALPGSLRVRALATYVDTLLINDGVNTYDRAGDVGDGASFTTPKWRANGSISYQDDTFGTDLRIRYVDGGKFNSLLPIVNNTVSSKTYVDLGLRFTLANRFTLSGTVNNVFDVDPPLVGYTTQNYDVIGRYFQVSVKTSF